MYRWNIIDGDMDIYHQHELFINNEMSLRLTFDFARVTRMIVSIVYFERDCY